MFCYLPSAFWGRVNEQPLEVELSTGATVLDLRARLFELFGQKLRKLMETSDGEAHRLAFVNGEARLPDAKVADGDTVRFVLPVGGAQV